jgi:hypothetical protein
MLLGAAVCGAWLASAAGVTRQAQQARTTPRHVEAAQFDALASDMQTQSARLRERLAHAPVPSDAIRNPFRFAERRSSFVRARRPVLPAAEPAAATPEIREPALQLIGIAETSTEDGVVRTAMIAGGYNDLMMVTAGQRILGRYEVVAVGADAVELKDVDTGAVRRLILQLP